MSVDFSTVLIEQMRSKRPEMVWEVMDVRHLQYEVSRFEVAIDKGTLDAMLHGSLWDPPADVRANVAQYVDEVLQTTLCVEQTPTS